jgi:hypothetical protein
MRRQSQESKDEDKIKENLTEYLRVAKNKRAARGV